MDYRDDPLRGDLELKHLCSLIESAVELAIWRDEDPEVKVREMAEAGIAGMVAYGKMDAPDDLTVTLLSKVDANIVFVVNGISSVDKVLLGNPIHPTYPPGQPTRTPLGDGRIVGGRNIVCGQKYMQEKRKKEEDHG